MLFNKYINFWLYKYHQSDFEYFGSDMLQILNVLDSSKHNGHVYLQLGLVNEQAQLNLLS